MKYSTSGLALRALAVPALAGAATVHVANNGVDTGTCGAFASPCRSITQAMSRAAAGDTVLVRPGLYGDLNRDGVLGGAGEESGVPGAVTIIKSLRIVSTDGASATVIDGGNGPTRFAVVWSYSSNVTFGEPGAGFLLKGAQSGLQTQAVTNVRIAGNIVTGAFEGMAVSSSGYVDVNNNVAHDLLGAGFLINSELESQRVYLHHNQ